MLNPNTVSQKSFAIKQVVGAERTQSFGERWSNRHFDWETPIVVIHKPTSKVRICGDFKLQ